MKRNLGWALAFSGAIALGGCQFVETDPDDQTGENGLAVTVDVTGANEVGAEAMRFHIETCAGEEVLTEEVDLEELEENNGQEHARFATFFAALEPGCYDVEMEALDGDGDAIAQCVPAIAEGVEIEAGETVSLVMVSQCDGDPNGAMDVLGVLNFAPTFTQVEIDPSTEIGCEAVEVCATAVDSDGDAIEFEWYQVSGPVMEEDPEITSTDHDNGSLTQCVEMTPGVTGEYVFQVVAFDLLEDSDGELVRIEDLGGEYNAEFRSRATVSFPLEVECEEGVLGEIEDKPHKFFDEDVLGELEDKPKYDREGVLGEVEDKPKDDEDVLGEVEDKPKYERDDVLGEVEEKPKHEDERVLGEVEEKPKHDDEDVLGEVEEDKPPKYREDVLGEIERDGKAIPEDVLGEIEDDYRKVPSDVLGEMENCTRTVHFWATFHAHADDPDHQVAWPHGSEDAELHGEVWLAIVLGDVEGDRTWKHLAQAYVVAVLNIKAGAEAPKGVLLALEEAKELLTKDRVNGAQKVRAKDLKGILMAYNHGIIGPGQCS